METGWLIDDTKHQLCLGTNGLCFFWTTYTSPEALRFARRRDAVMLAATLEVLGGLPVAEVDAVEHAWAPV